MRTPVSIGVIGLGALGLELASIFDELPQSELRRVCDPRPEVQLRTAGRFPRAVGSHAPDELLRDESVDAVVITTPPPVGTALLRRALESDKHVFVRGPLALDGNEADELVQMAEVGRRRLLVENSALFLPEVRKLKELVELERLGELFYVTATYTEPEDLVRPGSVVWTLGAPAVAQLLFLLDDEPVDVLARGDAFVRSETDVAFCHLRFATGIVAQLHLSRLDRRRTRRIAVVGSHRMAMHDELERDRPLTVDESRLTLAADGTADIRFGDVVSPRVAGGSAMRLQCEHFLAAIRSPADATPLRRDAAVVRTLEALERSLRESGPTVGAVAVQPLSGSVVRLPLRRR